ncbi:helix-turn-helix domain-containing protein [Sedimenticola selenatireducens]|uniref:helix-turn-helix domain-containing protein n=1 Tax=Sedimenticola selenatireducens TaxID=191960 RepID=UPI002AAB1050|nr:helix-turn-helix domain-containing protein [Sedimenticola selenatireducens]
MEKQKLAYSVNEVLQTTGLSRTAFYKLIREGKIRSYTVGERRFVSHQAILDFQLAHEEVAPELVPKRPIKKHRASNNTSGQSGNCA